MVDDSGLSWADEDGIVHIRNSERGTMDKCPQRWWWSWRNGLRPKETPKALWFGSAIHEALAHYYAPGRKRRTDFIDKFREYADMEAEYVRVNMGGLDEDEWVDARTLGETMLTGYVKHYGGDRDWDVIATEQTFELRIPWWTTKTIAALPPLQRHLVKQLVKHADFETEFFILNGTFDGVYRDRADRKVAKLMEHKTAASISWAHLTMDNQAGTYHMVAQSVGKEQGWLKDGENIREITYNYLRKGMPDERPRDEKGYCLNKPNKGHYIEALNGLVEWDSTRTGKIKYPTVAVLEEMAAEHGLTVLGDRSKSQPPPLYLRHPVRKTPAMRRMQLTRLQSEVTKMGLYVTDLLPVTKSASRDTCPMCPFKDMCELHETGGGWVEFRDAMFRSEDLYAVHRKSA